MNQVKTIGQLFSFFDQLFGGAKISGSGSNCNINVICPICHVKTGSTKSKLAIKADNFWTKCWVCGYKRLSIYYLIRQYHPEQLRIFVENFCNGIIPNNFDDEEIFKENSRIELPSGFTFLAEQFDNPKNIIAVETKKYLLSRGATIRDFWYFKYGVTLLDKDFKWKVIIPSFDSNGDLNYYTSRTIQKFFKGYKYRDAITSKENIIFNELNINWSKELTIVEGPFDLLKCNDNATCLLGSSLEKNYKLFQEIIKHETPVLLALDNDAKKKQFKIAKMLVEYDIPVRLYSVPKHFNDVGEMKKNEFQKGIESAKPFSLENELEYRLSLI